MGFYQIYRTDKKDFECIGLCPGIISQMEINFIRRENKMYKYEMIIYWSEEDKAFIVEVPELSGCMADGKTYKEAIENAQRVIEEWIEEAQELGREIPEPKGKVILA